MADAYYIVATRDPSGKLNADWDGELHPTRHEGVIALGDAREGWDDSERAANYAVLLECRKVDA